MKFAEKAVQESSEAQHEEKTSGKRRERFLAAVSGKALRAKLAGKVNRSLSSSEIRNLRTAYQNARSIKKYRRLEKKLGGTGRPSLPGGAGAREEEEQVEQAGSRNAGTLQRPEAADNRAARKQSKGADLSESRVRFFNGEREGGRGRGREGGGEGSGEAELDGLKDSRKRRYKEFKADDEDNAGEEEEKRERGGQTKGEGAGKKKRHSQLEKDEEEEPFLQKEEAGGPSEREEMAVGGRGHLNRRKKPLLSQMARLQREAEQKKAAERAAREAREAEMEQKRKQREEAEKRRKGVTAKLRKVTKRGQPVMKHRMEKLLESIQKVVK